MAAIGEFRVFSPLRTFLLVIATVLALPAIITVLIVLRDGTKSNLTILFAIYGFCLFMLAFYAVISYCILEINDTELKLYYPFRFLIGRYCYLLSGIASVTGNTSSPYSRSAVTSLRITFKKGQEQEYFLGHRSIVTHANLFTGKIWKEIRAELNSRGIACT